MCGGAVGAATVNGPQGSFKAKEDGTYNLLESRWSGNNLSVQGTFDNHELRNVQMTVGGGLGQPGDKIEFRNDGTILVNGQECKGEMITANGTKISRNGESVVIKTPDGDSFKMYLTDCVPKAINMEGEVSPQRAQGDVSGLVGTFADSIPEGQFPEGLGGVRNGDPNSGAFWASWAAKQTAKVGDEDDKRRKESAAAAEQSAQKGANTKAAAAKAGEKTPGKTLDGAKTGEAPQPGDPKPAIGGPGTGRPPAGTPLATPALPVAAK